VDVREAILKIRIANCWSEAEIPPCGGEDGEHLFRKAVRGGRLYTKSLVANDFTPSGVQATETKRLCKQNRNGETADE